MTADGDRPIPVRSVAPATATESVASRDASASDPAPPPPPSQPPRILETEQGRWEVRPIGRTRTGHGRDAGALLLLVRFDPVEAGGGEGETERPRALQPREGLGVARSLEDLDDEALEELLERARPVP
jgi:hypothetical protein